MDLLNGILNGGLGEGTTSRRSGSSAPRSGGTSVITNNTPLTEEEQNARHRGASYSSSGSYDRWYIDEETGRKIYTAGDKAGTWEQVQEPKPKSTESGNSGNYGGSDYISVNYGGSNAAEAEGEGDDTMLFLLLPVLAILAGKMLKRNKNRKRR